MAGDWIKMRTNLGTSPKVVRMASALDADRCHVVGGLHAVWCLFDAHSESGVLDGYTAGVVDDMIGWPGFAAEMVRVGWLLDTAQGLALPEFDEHNSQSAKRRAMEASRKRVQRSVRSASASHADKSVTREEKRREEKRIGTPPSGGPGGDPPSESDPMEDTRVTVVAVGAIRWNRGHGLTIPKSVVADLGRAHQRDDVERQLIAWELWRQGEGDHRGSRNPMGSITSWLENHPPAGSESAGDPVPAIPSEEQILAEIREVQAERGVA